MQMRLAVGIIVCAISPSLVAQWLNQPGSGIPRKADGKPDLSAPAPRLNGHPDLSGIWQLEPNICNPQGLNPCDDYQAGPEFGNLGARLGSDVPYQPWAVEFIQKIAPGQGKDDPVALCKPGGLVRLLTYPQYRKLLQMPGLVLILSERETTFRQIFVDGRSLPSDPNPTWLGYSVGKWDGDTLVVESVGFRDGIWLDRKGSPLTSAGKITEKYRRPNVGNLEIEITIDDPKAYTKPWTVKLHEVLVPDTDLLEYQCGDNEKDAVHSIGK